MTSEVSIGVENNIIVEDITCMDETLDKHGMDPLLEPIVGNPVGITIENYGNGDENLCSIRPRDESNDQYEMDIYDQNNTIETHREARIQDVVGEGATEPQENANPTEDEVVIHPSNFEQEIINENSEIRLDTTMDQTHRYSLRPSRSDWRHRFADQYSVPVVLANMSIPKEIRKFGSEALASVMK